MIQVKRLDMEHGRGHSALVKITDQFPKCQPEQLEVHQIPWNPYSSQEQGPLFKDDHGRHQASPSNTPKKSPIPQRITKPNVKAMYNDTALRRSTRIANKERPISSYTTARSNTTAPRHFSANIGNPEVHEQADSHYIHGDDAAVQGPLLRGIP